MENWFRDHPTYTIICHSIFIAATIWCTSSFILDENKVNLYKAQIENEKTMSEQYLAKISVLEMEIKKLSQENQKYLSWILEEPNSFPVLKNKIKILEKELSCALSHASITPIETQEINNIIPYEYKKQFQKGESFVDPKTKIALGISEINPDYTASTMIYLPDSNNIRIDKAKPGDTWEFEKDGSKYKLTFEGINWLNNSVEASIMETGKHNNKFPNGENNIIYQDHIEK